MPKPPPYPVPLTLVFLGILLGGLTALAAAVLVGNFHASAALITVPARVEVPVRPDTETVVWRELDGTHITLNRPLLDLSADLTITVTDAVTGQPVPTRPHEWWTKHQLFGTGRERRAIAAFDAPASGRVFVDVQGSFPAEQTLSIGPSIAEFRAGGTQAILYTGAVASGVLILTGAALAIWRASRTPELPDLA